MITKEKKEMEYADAPSGFVTLYQYKEPFMQYKKGFGYEGVLLFDGGTDKVQCHLCGEWFTALPNHLLREHNMRAEKYKEEVGLKKTTALIGEDLRAKLIAQGLDKRKKNLTGMKGRHHTEASKAKIRAARIENRRELQNTKGTCPEQLIDRLLKMYQENGNKTPNTKSIQFYEALMKTYGSYKHACAVAGIPYNDPIEALKRGHETQKLKGKVKTEKLIESIKDYYINNKALLSIKEVRKIRHNTTIKEYDSMSKEAVLRAGIYDKCIAGEFRFTEKELLDFLINFKKLNQRKPSYSDARRGLIPHLSRYSYHFGSWGNALKKAFG